MSVRKAFRSHEHDVKKTMLCASGLRLVVSGSVTCGSVVIPKNSNPDLNYTLLTGPGGEAFEQALALDIAAIFVLSRTLIDTLKERL